VRTWHRNSSKPYRLSKLVFHIEYDSETKPKCPTSLLLFLAKKEEVDLSSEKSAILILKRAFQKELFLAL
jgi:hypothetical protein